MPKVSGLGHVGIFVHDLMKQRDFYSRVMGLEIADEDIEGRGMVFLSAHPDEEHHEFVIMKGRTGGSDAQVIQQLSFKVDTLAELKEFHTVFKDEGVEIQRTVSHGNAFGMYASDPEGNTIEVYYKTGFPVPQPHGDPVDLDDSEEELLEIARSAIPAS
ncbi:MAG: VOC family protein [Dehalococcoidia bacterium]|nr:VOC family protein [Dehalococcoidia bacterium]